MVEALYRLGSERRQCCSFYDAIALTQHSSANANEGDDSDEVSKYSVQNRNLNESQLAAVKASGGRLTLIWGPPGKPITPAMDIP